VSLVVPRDVMHQLVPRSADLHGAILDSGNGRLFSTYLFSLLRQLPKTEQSQVPHIARATCHLLAACLLPACGQTSFAEIDHPSACREAFAGCLHLRGPDVAPHSPNAMFDDWIRTLRV